MNLEGSNNTFEYFCLFFFQFSFPSKQPFDLKDSLEGNVIWGLPESCKFMHPSGQRLNLLHVPERLYQLRADPQNIYLSREYETIQGCSTDWQLLFTMIWIQNRCCFTKHHGKPQEASFQKLISNSNYTHLKFRISSKMITSLT